MNITSGLLFVTLAGLFQGTFFLPMTYTQKWNWAHKWFTFSLLGMLMLNWIIAFASIEGLATIISRIPVNMLLMVFLFGISWGVGAILFGRGMDILGMALGYPIIMGINATAGTILPALIFSPGVFIQPKGILIVIGSVFTIAGIIACAKASNLKAAYKTEHKKQNIGKGLIIAVVAGFTSCLPNLSAAFSNKITTIAVDFGVSLTFAVNVVWSLFFTAGAIVNGSYCLFLIKKEKSIGRLFTGKPIINWLLMLSMSLMWIGSFYFYGIGCSMLDDFGLIIGWPLLVSLSIVIGNLWGLFRGEWREANPKSKSILNFGLFLLVLSVVIIAASNNVR
ncbi:MAG: L-rhamnose/proton symporter RhaT [Mangrovibacterium sp.]